MPRRARFTLDHGYFHLLNRSAGQVTLFRRRHDYSAFLDVLAEGLTRHPARLLAYCLMSNHWHIVAGPADTATLSRLLHWVTTTHAVRWRRRHRPDKTGPVYQGRFKAIELTPMDLMRACRYVERNAVSAGLVTRAQDWPWCSLSERQHEPGRLPLVREPFLSSNAWIDYVNAALFPGEEHAARQELALRDGAEDPGRFGRAPQRAQHVVDVLGGGDEDESDAHVERPHHLRVGDTAGVLEPLKERRHRPALAVE
jgi:putative transposase